jgi:5'-deoxynucleotidase YfbR-like HD superfamily hydrolase
MGREDLAGLLAFITAAERLKDTTRSGWTSTGRQDTVAGHTWRLCLMALVFHSSFPETDLARLLKICILHDLGEAIHGDVPAPEQAAGGNKSTAERADLVQFLGPLPEPQRTEFLALWDEYEAASTPEAQLAKALDKLETILQHNQGANPATFDYGFNLEYGRKYTDAHPLLAELRAELDAMTARRAKNG